jgi:hypothetical protein
MCWREWKIVLRGKVGIGERVCFKKMKSKLGYIYREAYFGFEGKNKVTGRVFVSV